MTLIDPFVSKDVRGGDSTEETRCSVYDEALRNLAPEVEFRYLTRVNKKDHFYSQDHRNRHLKFNAKTNQTV